MQDRSLSEHEIQANFIKLIRIAELTRPELKLSYAVPNGDYRPKQVAIKLNQEGVRIGVPDWVLPVARGQWISLMIEFKDDDGKVSEGQENYHRIARAERNKAVVHRNSREAFKEVINYLNL